MKKCEYCANEISYHEMYCSDECQMKANRYYERSEKLGRVFAVINTACVFGIPIGIFLMSVAKSVGVTIASGSCVVLGILLILLPLPTEGMIRKFKLKKALFVTRMVGVAVIAMGAVIAGFLIFVFN